MITIKTIVNEITTEEEFYELLKPIKNHIDDNASLDGNMFETFGEELDFVRQQENSHVWTYCEEDNTLFISSGYHHVNRLGYLVTENSYQGPEATIIIAEIVDDDNDGEIVDDY